ncbi:MAG: NAD-binding protein [Anaerovoracaceae bacterium]
MMNREENILLVGGLKKAKALAKVLIKKGYNVTIINKVKDDCLVLAEMEDVTVIYGDGSRPFVLEDANASHMGMVIALTKRDEDNLVICELCKKKYNIPKTVSLLNDPKKTDFFHDMGVDSVVCEINVITSLLEQQVHVDEITNAVPIDNDDIAILEIFVPVEAPVAGKLIEELNIDEEIGIGCIVRNGKSIIPRGSTQILSGDKLIVICYGKESVSVTRQITGRVNKKRV